MSRRSSVGSIPDAEDEDDFIGDDEEDVENVDESFLEEMGSPQKTPFKKSAKHFVFLLKGKLTAKVRILALTHPTNGRKAQFVLSDAGELLEVQHCGKGTSWFMNNRVSEDGGIFLTSPVDPLFLLIEKLDVLRQKHAGSDGVFIDVDQIFDDPIVPDMALLKSIMMNLETLGLICDIKSQGDNKYYRLNDNKLIKWLQCKADRIVDYIRSMPDAVSLVRAQVLGFKAKADDTIPVDQYLHAAVGFLKEYCPSKWIPVLKKEYGLTGNDAVYLAELEHPDKKRKADDMEPDDTPTKTPVKKIRKTVSQAKLEKVDTSKMNKMTAFFRPAAKK